MDSSVLASSIRAAFQARAAQSSSNQQATSAPAALAVRVAATGEEADLAGADLHWQPTQVAGPAFTREPAREVLRLTVEGEKEKGLNKQLMVGSRDPHALAKRDKASRPDTAGKNWFDLPAQKIDVDLKRELRLLRLRGAFDAKRFYKSFDNNKFPKHFALGTVVEGATEYYSGRLDGKQRRKATLSEQLLADPSITKSRKKRFAKLQDEASVHRNAKKRKTDLPRMNKSHHRPKH